MSHVATTNEHNNEILDTFNKHFVGDSWMYQVRYDMDGRNRVAEERGDQVAHRVKYLSWAHLRVTSIEKIA